MGISLFNDAFEPPVPTYYECPACGAEIADGTRVYINENGECVGCEECIRIRFAEDYFTEE